MASPRASDIKLIVAATVGVLVAGFLIAGAALVATRGSQSTTCRELNIGSASDRRKTLANEGPSFIGAGANCGFWIALEDNDIVAYKVKQPSGCTLTLRDQGTRWECGGRTVAPADLARYPVSIQTFGQVDAVIVELGPTATTTTTAA
ncbi:MAG TPA: hypothetical protein VN636_04900 [Acidimicrobiia bacterium]|nr:hypothetical protein [Acidimicrobiia bacterium]